jgi:hypothetical protein
MFDWKIIHQITTIVHLKTFLIVAYLKSQYRLTTGYSKLQRKILFIGL